MAQVTVPGWKGMWLACWHGAVGGFICYPVWAHMPKGRHREPVPPAEPNVTRRPSRRGAAQMMHR